MRFATQAVTAAAAVGVAVAASSAFTASNTVAVSSIGQGSSVSAGYVVSAIDYELKATGAEVQSVAFAVAPTPPQTDAARTVRVRLTAAGTYVPCTETSTAGTWTCNVSTENVSASAALTLDVVAAG